MPKPFASWAIVKSMLNKRSLDAIFHALADPTRRNMVETLATEPMAVSVLARRYDMTLSAVSQHLKVLIEGGLVQAVRVGRVRTCSLNPPMLECITDWADARRRTIAARLDRLEQYLAAERERPQ